MIVNGDENRTVCVVDLGQSFQYFQKRFADHLKLWLSSSLRGVLNIPPPSPPLMYSVEELGYREFYCLQLFSGWNKISLSYDDLDYPIDSG